MGPGSGAELTVTANVVYSVQRVSLFGEDRAVVAVNSVLLSGHSEDTIG